METPKPITPSDEFGGEPRSKSQVESSRAGLRRTRKGDMMGQSVIHFEVIGKDGERLRS
jgi:hypothetical protein